jgi:hypothetical protein
VPSGSGGRSPTKSDHPPTQGRWDSPVPKSDHPRCVTHLAAKLEVVYKKVDYEARRCTARSTTSGERCKKFAIVGGTVGDRHGGRAPQVRRAAAERAAREKVSRLGLLGAKPVDDPVSALMELGGQAVGLVDALREHVAELERVGTMPGRWGEQVKPEIAAYLSAIHEAERILTIIVRLNLEERLVRLDEGRAELVARVIERVLAEAGVDPQAIDVRSSVARQLRLAG